MGFLTSPLKDTSILDRGCEGSMVHRVRVASWGNEVLERAEVMVGVRVGAKHGVGRKSIRSCRRATVCFVCALYEHPDMLERVLRHAYVDVSDKQLRYSRATRRAELAGWKSSFDTEYRARKCCATRSNTG